MRGPVSLLTGGTTEVQFDVAFLAKAVLERGGAGFMACSAAGGALLEAHFEAANFRRRHHRCLHLLHSARERERRHSDVGFGRGGFCVRVDLRAG